MNPSPARTTTPLFRFRLKPAQGVRWRWPSIMGQLSDDILTSLETPCSNWHLFLQNGSALLHWAILSIKWLLQSPWAQVLLHAHSSDFQQSRSTSPAHAIIVLFARLLAADEYREWVRLYSTTLARHAAVRQVREFCDDLIGPLDGMSWSPSCERLSGDMWEPEVVGISKRQLLKEVVLPALSANRGLQRVLSEYIEMLATL